jgi:twitching motility protein PilU
MIRDGLITQEEGLSNSDSANNLLWLINNTAAGADFAAGVQRSSEVKPSSLPSSAPFSEFKLDTSETERA